MCFQISCAREKNTASESHFWANIKTLLALVLVCCTGKPLLFMVSCRCPRIKAVYMFCYEGNVFQVNTCLGHGEQTPHPSPVQTHTSAVAATAECRHCVIRRQVRDSHLLFRAVLKKEKTSIGINLWAFPFQVQWLHMWSCHCYCCVAYLCCKSPVLQLVHVTV